MDRPRDHPRHRPEAHDAQRREVLLHVSRRRLGFEEQLEECERERNRDGARGEPAREPAGVKVVADRLHEREHAGYEHQLPRERIERPRFPVGARQEAQQRHGGEPHEQAAEYRDDRLLLHEQHDHGHGEREDRVHRQDGGQIRLLTQRYDIADEPERPREESRPLGVRTIGVSTLSAISSAPPISIRNAVNR